jgi:hypothetical protein
VPLLDEINRLINELEVKEEKPKVNATEDGIGM